MNSKTTRMGGLVGWVLTCLFLAAMVSEAEGATRVLYRTGFEKSDGFDETLTLIGQDGWVGTGC